ncbi:hypothetical protein GALMADRAFT_76006 [Galerina marginata CBS 339.88]|uniref:DUF6830 domain-containing protein n=1 Tax=Galerina marginata (strain CBS 339.88) TaxID=685588 RepID=A0A067SSC5_GALM3|nr:hypothetical protein GALMADRAFT_76006 [Galerina marginata CBS 339.88]
MAHDVSGSVYDPFWKDFPLCDIHKAITPDVLHQLYQGVLKHIIGWCQQVLPSEKELDARLRTLPPAYGVRHFSNGWSALSQISGPERKHMARVLLGCLVGKIPKSGIMAIKALLDFIALAQYRAHDNYTLGYLQDALNEYHKNKEYFIRMNVRKHLNIPKFHSLHHYIDSIKLYGTTDNYNTETFERFHIDFAKEGWRASNKRDEFPQMVTWLSRQEKVSAFDNYLDWLDIDSKNTEPPPTPLSKKPLVHIAKYPPYPGRLISVIEQSHDAPQLSQHLKEYLNKFLPPGHRTSNAVSHLYSLPFQRLDVYTQFKFHPHSLQEEGYDVQENDTVKAIPRSNKNPNGRMDTVVVLYKDAAESTGVEGQHSNSFSYAIVDFSR